MNPKNHTFIVYYETFRDLFIKIKISFLSAKNTVCWTDLTLNWRQELSLSVIEIYWWSKWQSAGRTIECWESSSQMRLKLLPASLRIISLRNVAHILPLSPLVQFWYYYLKIDVIFKIVHRELLNILLRFDKCVKFST